jgi:hypothetical protein
MAGMVVFLSEDVSNALKEAGAPAHLSPEQVIRLLVEYAGENKLRIQAPRVLSRKR